MDHKLISTLKPNLASNLASNGVPLNFFFKNHKILTVFHNFKCNGAVKTIPTQPHTPSTPVQKFSLLKTKTKFANYL